MAGSSRSPMVARSCGITGIRIRGLFVFPTDHFRSRLEKQRMRFSGPPGFRRNTRRSSGRNCVRSIHSQHRWIRRKRSSPPDPSVPETGPEVWRSVSGRRSAFEGVVTVLRNVLSWPRASIRHVRVGNDRSHTNRKEWKNHLRMRMRSSPICVPAAGEPATGRACRAATGKRRVERRNLPR